MGVLTVSRQRRASDRLSESPLGVVLTGALAGFAGTLALTVLVKGAQGIASRSATDPHQTEDRTEQSGIGASEALAGGQVQPLFFDQAPELFVQKVATGLFGVSLSDGARRGVGMLMHVVYGGVWGAVYGLSQSSLRLPAVLYGLLYGLIIWLVGPGTLVPAMHIMPPPQRQPLRHVLVMVGYHAAYGLGLGLTFNALTRGERR